MKASMVTSQTDNWLAVRSPRCIPNVAVAAERAWDESTKGESEAITRIQVRTWLAGLLVTKLAINVYGVK